MEKKLIGKATHYFDKIGVAVIELTDSLKDGDKISIEKDGIAVEQIVSSMQIDKTPIKEAKKGQDIGMKVKQPIKENSEVYKIVE